MKKLLLSLVATLFVAPCSYAEEGMWLLPIIEKNMRDMKSKGLELPQRTISSIQHNGKAAGNAVVQFSNGSTGAVISSEGLVITNNSAASAYIQSISTVENNLSVTGFWAGSKDEEIPVPGLTVGFLRYMGNVTNEILKDVGDISINEDSDHIIESNKNILLAYYKNYYKGDNYKFSITSYFDGEFYVLTITEVFQDVRLVGIPPESVCNLGNGQARWQWPGYTGDFALFRVYTSPDGSSAPYSNKNVPYKTKSFLSISGEGYKEGDFAMAFGFPISTQRYMSDSELDFLIQTMVKPYAEVKENLLGIIGNGMSQNKEVQFKYGPKYGVQSNIFLKYKGMLEGIDKYGIHDTLKARDAKVAEWINGGPARRKQYGNALQAISNYNKLHLKYSAAREYIYETFLNGMDLLAVTQRVNNFRMANTYSLKARETLANIVGNYYKNYDAALDRTLAYEAIKMVVDKVPAELLPEEFKYELDVEYKGNIKAYVDYLYTRSSFISPERFMESWESRSSDRWVEDPAIKLLVSVQKAYKALDYSTINAKDNGAAFKAYKDAVAGYTRALRDLKILTYPDAGRNLRMTYGNVEGYSTAERGNLAYSTTLDEMMAAQKGTGSELPAKFKELYAGKAYANYLGGGDAMNVNFLTTTDVVGGNSGGPVLNASGNMIGLVFDDNWEGLAGNVMYDGAVNRTINIDMRYILYIIDKYAGAKNIMDEMTIIKAEDLAAGVNQEPIN